MKRLTAMLLSSIMLITCATPLTTGAAENVGAALYSFYDSNMLFQHDEPAVFAGTAPAGAEIKCSLSDESGATCAEGLAVAKADGTFEVSLASPAGGFKKYSVDFSCNGISFDSLTGVVFGELWLASGQSNMMMTLGGTVGWPAIQESGNYGSEWVRFLQTEAEPKIDGKVAVPNEVQEDLAGCFWLSADDASVGNVSAVAYYFADEMVKTLNMPVGVLNISLGGSPIRSWISRETLEGSESAMKVLKNHDNYISSKNWSKGERSYYSDMSSNYNAKIYPVRHFNIAGMIWYQGETELLTNYEYGEYTTLFELLQQDLTRCFGYTGGSLPIAYTQLACFNYRMDTRHLQAFNAEFAEIQQKSPESRAMASISDVSLDFYLESASIHPITKEPVGRRLAQAAAGLVYSDGEPYTAATFKSLLKRGNSLLVTFKDVGDGLVCDGEVLRDFAICGADGVYYEANAEIVSRNTVSVWCDGIKKPLSVTYAFSQANCRANLWSSKNGEKFMPVSPTITDRTMATLFYYDMPWTDCENEQYWRTASDEKYTGFYDLWGSEGCSYGISADSAFSGTAGLKVNADANSFSLIQQFIFNADGKTVKFNETARKWSKYSALRFKVRNCSSKDVTFSSAKIAIAQGFWFSPEVNGTGNVGCIIPADGEWHTVELDLNELYLLGKSNSFGFGSFVLDELESFTLCFEGSGVEIDDFHFARETTFEESINLNLASRAFNTLIALFKALFGLISK